MATFLFSLFYSKMSAFPTDSYIILCKGELEQKKVNYKEKIA